MGGDRPPGRGGGLGRRARAPAASLPHGESPQLVGERLPFAALQPAARPAVAGRACARWPARWPPRRSLVRRLPADRRYGPVSAATTPPTGTGGPHHVTGRHPRARAHGAATASRRASGTGAGRDAQRTAGARRRRDQAAPYEGVVPHRRHRRRVRPDGGDHRFQGDGVPLRRRRHRPRRLRLPPGDRQPAVARRRPRVRRRPPDLYEAPPASRRSYRYDDDSDTYYGADTHALGRIRDVSAAYRSTARTVEPSASADSGDHTPGMGTSGRISYGRRPSPQPARSDAYGFETYDRSEPVRRPPARQRPPPHGSAPGGSAAA